MSLLKVLAVIGTCAGITLLIASANLWLGILAMPIFYSIGDSLLSDE